MGFDVPPGVVTVTSAVPVPAGLIATISLAVSLTIAAGLLPKSTAVAFARFAPMIVSDVPPVVGPAVGLMVVSVGAAA